MKFQDRPTLRRTSLRDAGAKWRKKDTFPHDREESIPQQLQNKEQRNGHYDGFSRSKRQCQLAGTGTS